LLTQVNASGNVPEAGSDQLSFNAFDKATRKVKDALSYSDTLFCPEGHAPGTQIGVRVITNCPNLAPRLLAYLERAPKREPESQPITCYVHQNGEGTDFFGYAIEIAEEEGEESKSVAAVVIEGAAPTVEQVVAGINLSVEGITADQGSDDAASED
jgi:hypothetical protein